MTEINNEIIYYNLEDAPPVDTDVPFEIDTEGCNSVRVINVSTNGVISVNGFIVFAGEDINFRGNENELLTSKIFVLAAKFVGVLKFGFVVIKKTYKHGTNTI